MLTDDDESRELRRLREVERIAETNGVAAARIFSIVSRRAGDTCANCGHFVGDHFRVQTCKAADDCDCRDYDRLDPWMWKAWKVET